MKVCKTKYWQVNIPDDWQYEHQSDSDVLFCEDGVGEIQFSATQFDSPVTEEHLYELSAEHANADEDEVEFGEFSGITFEYETEDEFWQEWYLMSDKILLFITYTCELGKEENEIDVVEFILDSLKNVGSN